MGSAKCAGPTSPVEWTNDLELIPSKTQPLSHRDLRLDPQLPLLTRK